MYRVYIYLIIVHCLCLYITHTHTRIHTHYPCIVFIHWIDNLLLLEYTHIYWCDSQHILTLRMCMGLCLLCIGIWLWYHPYSAHLSCQRSAYCYCNWNCILWTLTNKYRFYSNVTHLFVCFYSFPLQINETGGNKFVSNIDCWKEMNVKTITPIFDSKHIGRYNL